MSSAYYDGLSMRGSGEDSHTRTVAVECDTCGWEGTTDIQFTTSRYTGTWQCPACDDLHEWETDQ